MNRLTIQSHATSGVLHALFLVLAFMAPVAHVLDRPQVPITFDRVATSDVTRAAPTTERRLDPTEFSENSGAGDVRDSGQGSDVGPQPKLRIEGDERAEPQLAAATAITDDVRGLLAGFANETIGEDSETALGDLDDGGGTAKHPTFRGFGLVGRGASCGKARREVRIEANKVAPRVLVHRSCKPAKLALGRAIATARAVPNLTKIGECDGQECVAAVTEVAEPAACTPETCPWKEIIERVIKRHRRELSYCYEESLRRRAEAHSAEVTATFVIPAAGGTAQVSMDESSGIVRLDDCVRNRAERWIFPETGYAIRANYPFRFQTL